ncbi:energy transducer TonB [Lichenicoccus sp.]|uniref:energy transducer TonB n=1 Tax=Lichenicoccus sp. TaxID=2781899 RepID=UPI003D13174B
MGEQAETSGISMIQSGSMARRDRVPRSGDTARPEARGAAPALAGLPRPGFVGGRTDAAVLDEAGLPLVRRGRRLHDGFGRRVAGSGAAHLLVLVLMALSFAQPPGGGRPQEQQPVDMVYERPGSSGMTGPSAPVPANAPPPPATAAPSLQPPTPAPPMPDLAPPPDETPPLPDLPLPEPLPQPMPNPMPQSQSQSRAATSRAQSRSTSPLSHPMDLSFAPATRSPSRRSGRPAGSGGPVDLSLGPLVQNGHLNTPYASTSSIKGVSDDYADEIGDWIRRHMYYPEEAARRGEDGPSHVHVVLDRQGQVRGVRLVTSSGSYLLDDATTGMFRNAKLPPVPPDMRGNSFDVDLTIDYILIRR